MKVTMVQLKKLRDKTAAPVMDVKRALQKTKGDQKKAESLLKKSGFEKVKKRKDRETQQGLVVTYEHHSGKIASMVEVTCETDFVAKNKLFSELGLNLAMQVASMNPKNAEELLKQDYIRDPKRKISELVSEVAAKTGENVRIGIIYRIELGKSN